MISAGYIKSDDGVLRIDPNQRVKQAIDLVFCKFRELRSIRQVYHWFIDHNVDLPIATYKNSNRLEWKLPSANTLANLLKNPIYAGSYAYGRTKRVIEIKNGRKHIKKGIPLPQSEKKFKGSRLDRVYMICNYREMVRPQRVEYEGAYYHVMNRGQGRRSIYHGEKYYEYFLHCLEQAHKRFAFEVHAYCLMGNHYHLLVRTPRGNLSRAMRHINGVYTQHYNYLRKTDGTLFRGRYKAINIEASSYLLEVSRYIHRNPIEMVKPIVKEPERYKWSSYPAYRNQIETPGWLYKESVYSELGSGQPTASYKRFVEAGIEEETEKFYAKNQWPAVRGSRGFAEKAHAHSNRKGRGVRRERKEIEAQVIMSAVASRFGCDEKELLTVQRGSGADNRARAMAIKLCQDYGSMKLLAIGELFGIGSESGVTKTISRLTARLAQESDLNRHYNVICQDLTP